VTANAVNEQQRIEPPRCLICGDLIRTGVVWFGEQMPVVAWHDAEIAVKQSDLLIVVGTSGMVYPAATLPRTAMNRGIPVIEVNADATDLKADFHLRGLAGEILPQLVSAAF
jgi:NAD-dependent deacetylase